MSTAVELRPSLTWNQLFNCKSSASEEQALFFSALSGSTLLPRNHDIFFPETRAGAWSIIAFDERSAYKLVAGKRKDGLYDGYPPDEARRLTDEYWRYSKLLADAGIQIPDQRTMSIIPSPLARGRVYLFEVQKRIHGVNGLTLLRDDRQNCAPNAATALIIFEQTLTVLLPLLRKADLGFGFDPHPANFIYDSVDLTRTPTFIDLLPPRPGNGSDYQKHLRLKNSDIFYRRRLHFLYEPAGLVKYLYNAFAAADPTRSEAFAKLILQILYKNGVFYQEIEDYFGMDRIGERSKDWSYMQRIFRAIGTPERGQSFQGNPVYLDRLPYYFTPVQAIGDQRLNELGCRSSFWTDLVQRYWGDSWSNVETLSLETAKPQISINMIMNQKRATNLEARIKDFERFQSLATGPIECVIAIGHPLTVAAFDEIKEICSKATIPITIILNKSPHPNISRNLATAASRGEIRFIIDDDCYVPDETFCGLYDRLAHNEEFIAVGASSVNPDGKQHKLERNFPSKSLGDGLVVVPGVHGMAFIIRGRYMDQYPIPPRVGKRGDWLPFFSLLQTEGGICVYDLSLPVTEHQLETTNNNSSISRRRFAGVHALLSMMHTLYETGVLLERGSRADSYLRNHYLGETLEGVRQEEWLSILWENLRAICTETNPFRYNSQQIYERMTEGLNQDALGRRNNIMLRWAGKLFLGNRSLVEEAKALMFELTSNQLLPPFHKFN